MSESAEEPPLRRPRADRHRPDRGGGPGGRNGRERGDRRGPLLTVAVAVAFALLYGWDLVEAIAALVALLDFAAAAGHPLNSYAWLVLGTGIVAPPVAYATALLVGRGGGPLRLAAVLAVGLAASGAVGLSVEALLRG